MMDTRNLKTFLLSTLLLLLWLLGVAAASLATPAIALFGLCLPLALEVLWWVLPAVRVRRRVLRSNRGRGPPFLHRVLTSAFLALLPTLTVTLPVVLPEPVQAATIKSDDFEGSLTGYQNTASFATNSADGIKVSGSFSVKNATTGQNWLLYSSATDGNNGDAQISAYMYASALTASQIPRVHGRSTSFTNINNCYWATYTSTGFKLFKRVAGTDTQLGSSIGSGQFAATTWYRVFLFPVGTTIRAKVQRQSDNLFMQTDGTWGAPDVWTISVTDSSHTVAGYWGIGYNFASGTFYADDFLLETFPALSVGVPSISTVTTTSVTTAVTASGGTSPYAYQWHIGATADFVVSGGTAVSGATAAASIISGNGLSATTAKFLKVVVTDSAGSPATVTSGVVWARLGVAPNSLKLGFCGDSITVTPSGSDNVAVWEAEILKQLGGFRAVDYFNGGISGSNTSNDANGWGTTATSTTPIAGQSGNYIAGFQAKLISLWGTPHPVSNPVWVIIWLGRNDALSNTSQATFQSQLSAIVNSFVAAGFSVILDAPIASAPGASSWSDAKTALVYSYIAAQNNLANGTTIRTGDRECPVLFGMFPALFADLIHPNAEGARRAAVPKAVSHLRVINPSALGSVQPAVGGGPVRRASLKRPDKSQIIAQVTRSRRVDVRKERVAWQRR